MPVNVVSNSPLAYLKQINRQQNLEQDSFRSMGDEFDIGPAFIVEISAKARRLQRLQGILTIVRL